MKHWLETNPFWLWLVVILGIAIASSLAQNSSEIISVAALFVGADGFVNSLWLNKRVNRMQDVLYEKHLAELGDFIVPKKPSHLDE